MFDSLQTSKLISYWLRHNPGDANLHADEFGWVSTEDLLKALNQRGQETAIGDLHTLNLSFDKIRWEFSDDQSGIRATHGHSIPVILPEGAVEPPAVLFHGSSSKSLESIIKTGLQPRVVDLFIVQTLLTWQLKQEKDMVSQLSLKLMLKIFSKMAFCFIKRVRMYG